MKRCCCDPGSDFLIAPGDEEWFVWRSLTGGGRLFVLNQSDASKVTPTEQTGKRQITACDDLGNLYAFDPPPGTIDGAMDIYKWDSGLGSVWTFNDTVTFYSGALTLEAAFQSTTQHFDLDGNYNFYYCGQDAGNSTSDYGAVVTKLNSSGSSVAWRTTIFEDMGGDTSKYKFVSCAVDLDGNVCAVGGRMKVASSSLVKSDYIIYYFDSDGNEVWHDKITDDTTPNADNLKVWAHQVCFDADGNVYVGFAYSGSPTNRPIIRKYDASGSVIWTKTSSAASHNSYNIITTTEGKLILQYRESTSGNGATFRQYSGSSHSTTDWTTHVSAAIALIADSAVDRHGDILAVTPAWVKLSKVDGSVVYTVSESGAWFKCVVKPGRHPHFI